MALKSHGVKAKKHLGQHFLNDEHVAVRLVESIQSARKDSILLEIGPGTGALTSPWLAALVEQYWLSRSIRRALPF